jgi:hypothetical protein
MTSWRLRSHPKVGAVVAAVGLLIAFWSIWPWAQRANDPTQSVYAGAVGGQRSLVLVLGLVVATVGVAVYCAAPRLLLAVSALAGAVTLLVAIGAIQDVEAITADDSELSSEVGWALYWIVIGAIVVMIASTIGVRNWRPSSRT